MCIYTCMALCTSFIYTIASKYAVQCIKRRNSRGTSNKEHSLFRTKKSILRAKNSCSKLYLVRDLLQNVLHLKPSHLMCVIQSYTLTHVMFYSRIWGSIECPSPICPRPSWQKSIHLPWWCPLPWRWTGSLLLCSQWNRGAQLRTLWRCLRYLSEYAPYTGTTVHRFIYI